MRLLGVSLDLSCAAWAMLTFVLGGVLGRQFAQRAVGGGQRAASKLRRKDSDDVRVNEECKLVLVVRSDLGMGKGV